MRKTVSLFLVLLLFISISHSAHAFNTSVDSPNTLSSSKGSFATGFVYTFIDDENTLWMWGMNDYGQLGDGTQNYSNIPIKVMDDVATVAVTGCYSAAIKNDGTLWTWGANFYGVLGNGGIGNAKNEEQDVIQTVPQKIMEGVCSISISDRVAAAIREDGSLWVWGWNESSDNSPLGNPEFSNSTYLNTPVQNTPVKLMDHVSSVSVDSDYGAAIKEDGTLWMWGWGYAGVLGIGEWKSSAYPIKVMNDVSLVYTGDYYGNSYAAAIKTDGSLWTWGSNRKGQLGNGGEGDCLYCSGKFRCQTTPVKIMDNVISLETDNGCCLAIKTDGSLWAWGGENDGKTTSRSKPQKIMENVKSVSMHKLYAAATLKDGTCWFWYDIYDTPYKVLNNANAVAVSNSSFLTTNSQYVCSDDGSIWKWDCVNNKDQTSESRQIKLELLMGIHASDADSLLLKNIDIEVGGKLIQWTDAEPFIDSNDRTLIPLRAVGDALGVEVDWDAENRTAIFSRTLSGEKRTIQFPIGSSTANTEIVSGGQVTTGTVEMDTAAIIRPENSRSYAPVRYLAEFFGYLVDWDASTRTAIITHR